MKVTQAHRPEGPLCASEKALGPKAKDRPAPIGDALRDAYRATFEQYAAKLKILQSLLDEGNEQGEQIDAATFAVEQAHLAYSSARDRLARELMRLSKNRGGAVDEQQIRNTARLIWEFAGRPEGTAERDWHQAEKLVCAVSGC